MSINKQAEILAGLAEFRSTLENELASDVSYADVISALSQFSECVRYLNTRRSGTEISLEDEASVQDAAFLMLRPWIPDLVPESPGEKTANRYTIKDFFSKNLKTIIEVKFIRSEEHGKNITKELYDDIENYRHNLNCEHLIFFIYDPNSYIPGETPLRAAIEEKRVYGEGRPLYCHLVLP